MNVFVEREDVEQTSQPWGAATEAVEAAFDFWDWRETQLNHEPTEDEFIRIKDIVKLYLPEELRDSATVQAIIFGTYNLTLRHHGYNNADALNDAILAVSQDPNITADSLELAGNVTWKSQELLIFARLAINNAE